MFKLRVATVVLLCAVSQDALALDPPPTAAQLREWAAGPCVTAGKHAGIDYAHLLYRAIAADPAGLAALFRFTDTGWFDGAAAEVTVPSWSVCCSAGATDHSLTSYERRNGRFAKQSSMLLPRILLGSLLSSR
jgi:hypothetical protein